MGKTLQQNLSIERSQSENFRIFSSIPAANVFKMNMKTFVSVHFHTLKANVYGRIY